MPRTLLALALMLIAACSDSGDKPSPDDSNNDHPDACKAGCLDGSVKRFDASSAPIRPLLPDSAVSDELRAQVQVNGANTQCGTCSVILAQAQGGKLPYTYEWSDPSLQGPGPHMVCPDAPTSYSVVITDSSEVRNGEFYSPAQQVQAVGETHCVTGDAGAGFQGCLSQIVPDAGSDGGAGVTCPDPDDPDAGVTFDLFNGARGTITVTTDLGANAFKAGQSYEYSHDRLVPITLSVGEAVRVDVYGANTPCGFDEKLFTLTYDLFTWHQSFCFTPKQNYRYLIVQVHLNGALFSWEFLATGTTCAGCGMN
jgi:hypothetical protein